MKKTQQINIRVPIKLIEDLKNALINYPTLTMTDIIVRATIKDVQRYL